MRRKLREISILFAAGCVGGWFHLLMLWGFQRYGIDTVLGVELPYPWAVSIFYPKIVWGGLWGQLFLLKLFPGSVFQRAALLSLVPSAFELFIASPFFSGTGLLGWGRGMWTPAFIVLANIGWGLGAALHLWLVRSR